MVSCLLSVTDPKEVSTLDSVAAGLKVELGPLFAVVDLLKEYGNTGLLRSIVMYSSTAANSSMWMFHLLSLLNGDT